MNMTYPDGRVLSYDYGSANSTSDRISRLACITDSTGTLESYEYLGLSTVVIRSHPQADVSLSYLIYAPLAHGEAGDIYSGLDRFGRVVDQRWVQGNGTEIDRFQYGYDRNSNRLWRDNLMNTSFGELYGSDNLGQLTSMQRGELDGNRTGIVGNASRSQDWAYDPLGNWNGVTTDGVEETRTHDAQNRVVGVGNATLTFDPAGNMLTDEQGQRYAYDAWNRLKTVWDSSNTVIASYEYDALRRRVVETHGNDTKDLLYSSQWQVLEERDAATGNTTMSYAWSPVYVDAMIERDRDTDGNGSLDERLWVQQDANWNVTSVALANGSVGERYVYDAYGVRTVLKGPFAVKTGGSDYGWVYGFQSGRLNDATGNYIFERREGRPTLGRWTTSDPIQFSAGDVNTFRFEQNNSINRVDPTGLISVVLSIIYNENSFTEYGLKLSDKAKAETNRILKNAVGRFAVEGSNLTILWNGMKEAIYQAQKTGWVENAKAASLSDNCKITLGTWGIGHFFYSSPEKNYSLILKLDLNPTRGPGSIDVYGHGSDYSIVLYRDGIMATLDADPAMKANLDLLIGGAIAHELVHALGRTGHAKDGYIDSSSLKLGGSYSDDGAKYIAKKFQFKIR